MQLNSQVIKDDFPGRLLLELESRKPIRAGSLIITVFGDSISLHGNSVWMGSLINALDLFGLNPRQIRTSVYRLVNENWLQARQVGRRSYYSFTQAGLLHYKKAARRIYAPLTETWDGLWTLVIATTVNDPRRDQLRKELLWLGYGNIAPGVFVYAGGERQSLDETLNEMGLTDEVVVIRSTAEDVISVTSLGKLAHSVWNLDELKIRYEEFINQFYSLQLELERHSAFSDAECFQLRTLLIHEYRRILLMDSDLPSVLLPEGWAGASAHKLTASLYKLLEPGTGRFQHDQMESIDGPLPPASNEFPGRFEDSGPVVAESP
jgi:phenylacetic acid degradation operon negative regulatory protein